MTKTATRIKIIDLIKGQKELDEIQYRAKERLVTMNDIRGALAGVESSLDGLLPVNDRAGLLVTLNDGACSADFPWSYKYTPQTTQVVAERGATGWRIVEVRRVNVGRKGTGYYNMVQDVAMTPVQRDTYVANTLNAAHIRLRHRAYDA